MWKLFHRFRSTNAFEARRAKNKEISAAERVRLAHENRIRVDSEKDYDHERVAKILALFAGLILAGTGFFVASQFGRNFPPVTVFFFIQGLGGVAVVFVASQALNERKPLPYWTIILSWWVLPVTLLFIWILFFLGA